MLDDYDLTECVGKYREMDIDTEVVLPGGFLRNGMRVLSVSELRYEQVGPPRPVTTFEARNLRINNRWCTVTHLSIFDDDLCFIAVYDDGIQEQRIVDRKYAWVIKRNTIRKPIWQRFYNWWNSKQPLFRD